MSKLVRLCFYGTVTIVTALLAVYCMWMIFDEDDPWHLTPTFIVVYICKLFLRLLMLLLLLSLLSLSRDLCWSVC